MPRVICGDIGLTENTCDGGREMVPGAWERRDSVPLRSLLPFRTSCAREVDFVAAVATPGPVVGSITGAADGSTVDAVVPSE
jgi:hypothetical protein